MGGIIWLASYPKSGNTWLRVFLANLRGDLELPVEINEFDFAPIASRRRIFDEETGIEASDLTSYEIDRLRPEVYEQLAAKADEILFMKVHDAYTTNDRKLPLFPEKATVGTIYIIRNPMDVAISFPHHSGLQSLSQHHLHQTLKGGYSGPSSQVRRNDPYRPFFH